MARPTPLWERTLKWARRRPAAAALVGLSAAIVLALGIGGPIFAWHFRRLADEEAALRVSADQARSKAESEGKRAEDNFQQAQDNFQQAEENFQQVQKAMDQLTEVGQQRLANVPGMEKVREELLGQALEFYKRFLNKKKDNPFVRWQSARAFQRVGDLQAMLEKNEDARASYLQAQQLFVGLTQQFPDNPKYREDLAACHNNLGNLLQETNDLAGARQAYDEALKLRQQLAEEFPAVRAYRQERAAAFNNLGNLLRKPVPPRPRRLTGKRWTCKPPLSEKTRKIPLTARNRPGALTTSPMFWRMPGASRTPTKPSSRPAICWKPSWNGGTTSPTTSATWLSATTTWAISWKPPILAKPKRLTAVRWN